MNLTREQLKTAVSALTYGIVKKGAEAKTLGKWKELKEDIQKHFCGDDLPITVRCPPSYQETVSDSAAE